MKCNFHCFQFSIAFWAKIPCVNPRSAWWLLCHSVLRYRFKMLYVFLFDQLGESEQKQQRIIRICALYVWFHYSQYLIREVLHWHKKEARKKRLWRLFEWSRSLNAAAAHHAHCTILQYVLAAPDQLNSKVNSGYESSSWIWLCLVCM